MNNKIINKDLKLNIIGKVMDRDRFYALIKKCSPFYWYIRPFTKFLLNNTEKDIICAEIGVDYGLNAKTMLKFLPVKKLYLIDPYEEDLDKVTGDERYLSTKKYLKKYSDKIEFVRKTSKDTATSIPNNLDFVYLDGSHKYDDVKQDIELYYSKIKKGGILGGHDFWGNEVGVCKAVIEFVNENDLKLYGGFTDWWIIKK